MPKNAEHHAAKHEMTDDIGRDLQAGQPGPEQVLSAAQQELLMAWAGHIEATMTPGNEVESLVSLGLVVRSVDPMALQFSYSPTPAGVMMGHTIAALIRQQAAQLAEARAELERERGRVIDARNDELARIDAEIKPLIDEFDAANPRTHWALSDSLSKLINALYDQKTAIKRVADWQAVVDQDRRQAPTPEASHAE